eukprot:GHRR01011599.1.p1 GENE.GHRR01011599.1~~GHRR01011599.1.p1  ORF type:complete len:102 (-),score=2.26 GHRR01011599.1:141-446(-)
MHLFRNKALGSVVTCLAEMASTNTPVVLLSRLIRACVLTRSGFCLVVYTDQSTPVKALKGLAHISVVSTASPPPQVSKPDISSCCSLSTVVNSFTALPVTR